MPEKPSSETAEISRIKPFNFSGLTGGLLADSKMNIQFYPGRSLSLKNDQSRGRVFRHLLRGIVEQVVLAAAGKLNGSSTEVVLIHSSGPGEGGMFRLKLKPVGVEAANKWLALLAVEQTEGPHAYLLPCEAVFLELFRRVKADRKEAGQKPNKLFPFPAEVTARPPSAKHICAIIEEMAANERWNFSSCYGPVPAPRSYLPLPEKDTGRAVNSRFGLLISLLDTLEVI